MRTAILADATLSRYYPYISVADENGSLVLSGALPSQQLKDSLEAVAVRVGGPHFVDRVNVGGSPR
jgi:hypothetical protein